MYKRPPPPPLRGQVDGNNLLLAPPLPTPPSQQKCHLLCYLNFKFEELFARLTVLKYKQK